MTIVTANATKYPFSASVTVAAKARSYKRGVPPGNRPINYLVRVANRGGRFIGQLNGNLESVIWRVNDYGRASIVLPATVMEDSPELLDYGNYIHIWFTGGLPQWGGVIDLPLEREPGLLRVSAFSAEHLLTRIQTHEAVKWSEPAGETAASILRSILSYKGHADSLLIDINWDDTSDGDAVSAEFRRDIVLEAAKELARSDTQFRFFLQPQGASANKISFDLVTYQGYRRDMTRTVHLVQGVNLTDVQVIEQGPIYNTVTAMPSGSGWDESKVITHEDAESIATYGRRAAPLQLVSTDSDDIYAEAALVGQRAESMLAAHKQPRIRFTGTAVNMPPSTYADYRLGDRVTVHLNDMEGLAGAVAVRIWAMEFSPTAGTLQLVFEFEDGETELT